MTIDGQNIQWKQGFGFIEGDRGTQALGVKDVVDAIPDTIIATEDFEGGPAGTGLWIITTTNPHSGVNALTNNDIGNSQTTDQVFTIPFGATHLRFWHRVSSELNFDFFRVLVDAAVVFSLSGTANVWAQTTVALGAGTTVTFRYTKDSSASSGLDSAFIDDLEWIVPGVAAVQNYEPFHLTTDNRVKVDAVLDEPISVTLDEPIDVNVVSSVEIEIKNDTGSPVPVVQTGVTAFDGMFQTTVPGTATLIAAAGVRQGLIIQNVGISNIRVGPSTITAVLGIRLRPGDTLTFSYPDTMPSEVYAIREGAVSGTVNVVGLL